MTRIRVLVVDDSATVRGRVRDALSGDPDLDIVGEATDGHSAIELCRRIRPDVVTMDMMLPRMNGLSATEHIMAICPTPILVVSSASNRGELFQTYDALAAGAVDVLEKPSGDHDDHSWERRLVAAVKLVSRIRVITHPRARWSAAAQPQPGTPARAGHPPNRWPDPHTQPCDVVGVGASTGGPQAIVEVLRALPRDYRVPVLLVLHINEPFGSAFADWLAGQLSRAVRYPRDGELLAAAAGQIIMAPPGRHLRLDRRRLHLNHDAERHSCRPSVDVLFDSLAQDSGPNATGCLLTGMGRDGAEGLLAIRNRGGRTVAQDEASSVVYGMPREALRLGAAQQVLPLKRIGAALAALHTPPDPVPS